MPEESVFITRGMAAELAAQLEGCKNADGSPRLVFWSGAVRPARRSRSEPNVGMVLKYHAAEEVKS